MGAEHSRRALLGACLTISIVAACAAERPDHETCEQAADAMVRIFTAHNADAGPAAARGTERQQQNFAEACRASATKEQAECTIAAQTVQDLEDCE